MPGNRWYATRSTMLGCTAGRSTTLVADLQALSLRTIEDAEDWESH